MELVESIPTTLESADHDEFQVEVITDVLDPEWVAEAIAEGSSRSKRRRKLLADFMVFFVILMGLYRRVSYANLLEKLHGTRWTQRTWGDGAPPTTRAVTEARGRLGVETMSYLFLSSAIEWERQVEGKMLAGLRCYALDGVCMKVTDTDENREHYGVPKASRGKSAFPQLRSVLLVDVATHQVRAERHGPIADSEIALAWKFLQDIYPGMLVIMDRNFHAAAFLCTLMDRGAGVLVRAKRKHLKARAYQRLGPGDDLVWVRIPKSARRDYPDLPSRVRMRRVTYRPVGGREDITLLTTILDPEAASAEELAAAYHDRWEGESAFDELKTHLCDCATVNRPVVFRSKTPRRVEQEFYGLLIAFNVVCRIKAEAVEGRKVVPGEVSFVAAIERIREALQEMLWLPAPILTIRRDKMLKAIRRARIKRRHGRSQPRAVRVKMSSYPVKHRAAA